MGTVPVHAEQQQMMQVEGELVIGVFTKPEMHPSSTNRWSELSYQAQGALFHAANPWVCEALEHMARLLVDAGLTRFGTKLLFERLRWEWAIHTGDKSGFHLSNNYTAFYARLMVDRNPAWAEMIETRELTSVK